MAVRNCVATLGRFGVVCAILVRQLLAHLPHRFPSAMQTRSRQKIDKYLKTRQPKVSAPQSARETLERLGPTFVKFGQFLSVRPDLVPAEYCAEFRELQDHVAPFPVDQVRLELATALRRDPDEVFSEFDTTPVAAASVAQVHRARLRSGEEVAIKVQRPRVRERMEEDILIMLFLAHLLERVVVGLRKNRLVMLIHEFSRWTSRELDFRNEGQSMLFAAHNFAGYPGVHIPRVYLDLTTERVLVMEFMHGVNVLDAEPGSFDRKTVARVLADAMLKQIFVDGFFHGDPHAGNVFVLPDGDIALIDFGIVGYMTPEKRELTFELLHAMAEGQSRRVVDTMMELCDTDEEQIDLRGYRREMNEVVAEMEVCRESGSPFTHLMQRFLNTSLEFGLDIPPDFVIMSKAITTLEGTCLSMDPSIRLVDFLRPFVDQYLIQVPDLDSALKQLKAGPFEVHRLQRLLFKHGARALRTLERPTLRIEGREFRRAVRELEKTSLNVSSGLLIAALVIFAATVSNTSVLEQWLSRVLHLPAAPILSLSTLAFAAYLWIRLYVRNRPENDSDHLSR